MKTLLSQLINWMERTHFQRARCGSPFEEPVSPILGIRAEAALTWALATRKPLTLFITTFRAEALLAALVLRRSGVTFQQILNGDLHDDDFGRLTRCVAEISRSRLKIVEGEPPAAMRKAAFFGGPLFAITPQGGGNQKGA